MNRFSLSEHASYLLKHLQTLIVDVHLARVMSDSHCIDNSLFVIDPTIKVTCFLLELEQGDGLSQEPLSLLSQLQETLIALVDADLHRRAA